MISKEILCEGWMERWDGDVVSHSILNGGDEHLFEGSEGIELTNRVSFIAAQVIIGRDEDAEGVLLRLLPTRDSAVSEG